MKKIVILAFSVIFATNVLADITCTKPTLKKSAGHNSLYHFKSEATCTLKGEKVNVKELKDLFKAEILDPKSQFKVHAQQAYSQNGLQGYSLDVTQEYNTKHGFASVHAMVILADDANKKFFMELRSKSMHGDGEESYNKSILNQTTLEVLPDHAEVVVVKEIDVQDPWYVPDTMFFDTVESELQEATSKSALLLARKISGQNVEALRK